MGVSSDCFESLLPAKQSSNWIRNWANAIPPSRLVRFMTIPAEDQANRLSLRNAESDL
jgi:hypothetical protein